METNTNVLVVFLRDNVYEFQHGSLQLECVLLHIPQGEGDHFHFEYRGIKFSVNPLCADFAGIVYK